MKLANIVLYVCLAGGLGGCSGGELPPDRGKTPPRAVPITLQAGSQTKAVINEGAAFEPLLLCANRPGEYHYLRLRWKNDASVSAGGDVTYQGYDPGKGPTYPYEANFPYDIYVCGVHPQGADLLTTNNAATYTINGSDDIMYAPEVFGNYLDGQRIHGNTNAGKDKPLVFSHLLTQLKFKAYRTGNGAGDFQITKITIKDVLPTLTINLENGDVTVGGEAMSLDAQLTNTNITSDDETNPTEVGYSLLPPAEKYEATLVTSAGNFDITIKTSTDVPLEAGKAHVILLKLIDYGVILDTVTVASWEDVDSGGIDL